MRRLRLGMMSGGVPLDPDAVAFLTAAGITDATITTAINTLVIQLKSFGIWTKMKAIYPFVGGTATTHKFNLKNPVDSDAAFRLVFSGGITHSPNGALPNGSNGNGQTKLRPSATLTPSNWHFSYYSRTNNNIAVDFDMGVGGSIGERASAIILRRNNNLASFDSGDSLSANRISSLAQIDSLGFYIGSIRSNTDRVLIKNGTNIIASSTSNLSNSFMDSEILLFAYNQVSFGPPSLSPSFYGSKQCAFSSIGDGLTDTEASNYYTAVQAFQTTLGRQV